MKLKHFFAHKLHEGPTDPAFQPAPEVQPAAGVAGAPVDPNAPPADPTQDVAKLSATSLSFFTKNVNSVAEKAGAGAAGFNVEALRGFAGALDDSAYQMYSGVQDPQERQNFEAEYQKIAADWSKDISKLFEKLQKLKSYAA